MDELTKSLELVKQPKVVRRSDELDILYELARTYCQMNNKEKAIDTYLSYIEKIEEPSVAFVPRDASACVDFAILCYEMGQLQNAYNMMGKSIEIMKHIRSNPSDIQILEDQLKMIESEMKEANKK